MVSFERRSTTVKVFEELCAEHLCSVVNAALSGDTVDDATADVAISREQLVSMLTEGDSQSQSPDLMIRASLMYCNVSHARARIHHPPVQGRPTWGLYSSVALVCSEKSVPVTISASLLTRRNHRN